MGGVYYIAVAGELGVAVVAVGTAESVDTRWTVDHFVVESLDLGDADRPGSDANSHFADSLAVDELDTVEFGLDVRVAADCSVDCFAE